MRIRSLIEIPAAGHRPVKIEPDVYLAEDVDDKVILLPSDGEGQPLAVMPTLTFDGLLRRREAVFLSW